MKRCTIPSLILCNLPNKKSSKSKKIISKKNNLYIRQLSTEVIIDTAVVLYTSSFVLHNTPTEISRQIITSYQNDFLLVTLSSFVNNFFTRGILYFTCGFFTSLIGSFLCNSVNYKFTLMYALSMFFISNYRYITLNNIEKNNNSRILSVFLRIVNNTIGSLQYIVVEILFS
tara:strand:- start:795 stop:1310 length:516 start_codon:yes stop_codon:yes gene_type:complete